MPRDDDEHGAFVAESESSVLFPTATRGELYRNGKETREREISNATISASTWEQFTTGIAVQ